jgi:hypothetical protein
MAPGTDESARAMTGSASEAPRNAAQIPSPVKGSKKSAASPTSNAPPAMTRDARRANGPVTMSSRIWPVRGTRPRTDA